MLDFALAVDTLLIFVLIIIPGMAFRRFYFRGEFSKQYNSRSLSHALIASIPSGIIVQYFTVFAYSKYSNLSDLLIKSSQFLTTFKSNNFSESLFKLNFTSSITFYMILMILISFLLAQICWLIVRLFKLDRKYNIFRYRNHWNYYLNGELNGFKQYEDLFKGKKIGKVNADILVRIENDEPRLYSGNVAQHTINNSHELQYIYLTGTSIFKKNKVSQKRERRPIQGDVMIISASDIININLSFEKHSEISKRKKYKTFFNSVIIVLTLLSVSTVLIGKFNYTSSGSILQTLFLKTYLIFLIFLISILLKNIYNRDREHNKEIMFGQTIILFISLIIYSLLKYYIKIF